MAMLMSIRGTALLPRFTQGQKGYAPYLGAANLNNPPVVAANANPGVFGGSVIDLTFANNSNRSLIYRTGSNWVNNTRVFSMLLRLVPNATGIPANDTNIFLMGQSASVFPGGIRFLYQDNGLLRVDLQTADAVGGGGFVISGAPITWTLNVPTDLMVVSDGTNIYLSQDGVQIGAGTWSVTTRDLSNITPGSYMFAPYPSNYSLNEFVVWNSVEPHVYAVRTDFIPCADFNGSVNTDPGEGNVLEGVPYISAGVAKEGSYVILVSTDPGESNVLEGVAYMFENVAKEGTYVILNSTDPGEGNVLSEVAYVIDNVDKVGTLLRNIMVQAVTIGQAPPSDAPIELYVTRGDDVVFNLKALCGPDLGAFNLTGATFLSKMKDGDNTIAEYDNDQHEANPDQDDHEGEFTLTLTDEQTEALKLGAAREIVTKITIGAQDIYFHARLLVTVLKNDPET